MKTFKLGMRNTRDYIMLEEKNQVIDHVHTLS